jgi:Zn-dependent peptidase ImmA (M78 family)
MKGSDVMKERAIQVAHKVRHDYKQFHELFDVPVNVYKLCDVLGIEIHVRDMSEVENQKGHETSGALGVNGDEKVIFINASDVRERQRFTIAHELGHYFMHVDKNSDPDYVSVSFRLDRNPKEREADWFAAELLMPEERVRKEHGGNKATSLSRMARKFDVSTVAMSYKLDLLGLRYI